MAGASLLALQGILRLNPVFHMIDGFRQGFIGPSTIGQGAGGPLSGMAIMLGADLAVFWLCHAAVARGWRLKP